MNDLAIIGGGPAGYTAAERAAALGLSVVLFERKELGGVCLNEGCIPTKTLLYSAKVYDSALAGAKYGVTATEIGFDYGRMVLRKNKVVRKLVLGIAAKMKEHGVEVVRGDAKIIGRKEEGFEIGCNGVNYLATNIIIATGSEAFIPPINGVVESIADGTLLTNREILALKELPKSLVVIGGGVIGMEFASLYNSLGVEVTVIEMMGEILGNSDAQMSTMLREDYAKRGVKFNLGCQVTSVLGGMVSYRAALTEVTASTPHTGDVEEHIITADKILMSVGRRPVTEDFGLENLGVELYKGGVKVDERMRTNVANLFAAGDVTGYSLFAHTAVREAEVIVNNLTSKSGPTDKMNYDAIPAVVYTNPELSSVGLTVEAAALRGIACEQVSLPMAFSGRFVAENEGVNGLCKLVVDHDGRVLGASMIGNPSSEIIFGVGMAIERGMTAQEVCRVVFPHPTVSEIIKDVLAEFK